MKQWNDRLLFFQRFIHSPRLVGSVMPSSSRLVAAMLDPIPWNRIQSIVELGAGTGTLTRALNQRFPSGAEVLIFEKDPVMAGLLKNRFPHFDHYEDAARLPDILNETGIEYADVILSGLPFAAFSRVMRNTILDAVRDSLSPEGLFVTFQYSLQAKKALEQRFEQVQIRFTPWNIPPAFVYVCRVPSLSTT